MCLSHVLPPPFRVQTVREKHLISLSILPSPCAVPSFAASASAPSSSTQNQLRTRYSLSLSLSPRFLPSYSSSSFTSKSLGEGERESELERPRGAPKEEREEMIKWDTIFLFLFFFNPLSLRRPRFDCRSRRSKCK